METELYFYFSGISLLIVLGWVWIWYSHHTLAPRTIKQWAKDNSLEIWHLELSGYSDSRKCPFGMLERTRFQSLYCVHVRSAEGKRGRAWILCGSQFFGMWPKKIEVRWDHEIEGTAGSKPQKAKSNFSWKRVALLIPVAVLGYFLFFLFVGRQAQGDVGHKNRLASELHVAAGRDIRAVEIIQDQVSDKRFSRTISTEMELAKFKKAIASADTVPVRSHNGPIYECTLIIKFQEGEIRYLGTVHRNQTRDMYLSNRFWVKTETGYQRGRAESVRIPNMGSWVMKHAP